MDGEQIQDLENQIAEAVREVVDVEVNEIPEEVFHFMAKAAVAVLEAAVEMTE